MTLSMTSSLPEKDLEPLPTSQLNSGASPLQIRAGIARNNGGRTVSVFRTLCLQILMGSQPVRNLSSPKVLQNPKQSCWRSHRLNHRKDGPRERVCGDAPPCVGGKPSSSIQTHSLSALSSCLASRTSTCDLCESTLCRDALVEAYESTAFCPVGTHP